MVSLMPGEAEALAAWLLEMVGDGAPKGGT